MENDYGGTGQSRETSRIYIFDVSSVDSGLLLFKIIFEACLGGSVGSISDSWF